MGVIQTDEWLLENYKQPIQMCNKLVRYFPDATAAEVHSYLGLHGMYQQPMRDGESLVRSIQQKNVWKLVQREFKVLQDKWDGPDVPIFIFPADHQSAYLQRYHQGKSGLAFKDKLFLFISEKNTQKEIRALFTHEYNHVCRLKHYKKRESDYTLLDTVILEGLAENAVRERFDEAATADWTRFYTKRQLERMWRKLILPYSNIRKETAHFEEIMYGFGLYPKMAGYAVGYHVVKTYMDKKKKVSSFLLLVSSETIAQQNGDTDHNKENND